MLKFILPIIILVGCSHAPQVQYNDPEVTREEEERRSLLIGKWKGENSFLELKTSGEYVVSDFSGEVTQEGIWGVSGRIYFNLNKKSPSLYEKYKIMKLNPEFFEIQSATAEELRFTRLK